MHPAAMATQKLISRELQKSRMFSTSDASRSVSSDAICNKRHKSVERQMPKSPKNEHKQRCIKMCTEAKNDVAVSNVVTSVDSSAINEFDFSLIHFQKRQLGFRAEQLREDLSWIIITINLSGEFMCKSCDGVRYNFTMRTAMISGHEIQPFCEGC